MNLTIHQKRILREMKEREVLQDGYLDQARDRTTDAERTERVDVLSSPEYDEEYNDKILVGITE